MKKEISDISQKISDLFNVSKVLLKYAFGIWLLLVIITYVIAYQLVELEGTTIGNWILCVNIFVAIPLTILFRNQLLDFNKEEELKKLNKKLQAEALELEKENRRVEKGDLVKFEYETSTDSKFYSVKLVDIEFDANADWGTFGVLIAETSKGKTRKFFDHSLMSEVIYKGKKYENFEELHEALNR
ncbi:hypothetical protein BKK49_09060 [Rodentibacter rarus]|uniref:hypothetical protein n=1 Tax=Rodentibacter rarus TaxID=1908260 RepID=UPI0009851101|nr:hypothetical protein [Rodentibacter rarus]OOF38842.1 hypothetical protein BKK49_09060 [Rodentibacter rarus]